ncbi:Hypothetical predicted protein [Octopus vulgaris]|uniref:VWFA domain-containing protein n=1 Tax=Octopus vulgaris TaxID=6645 RepID=A0AA36ATJ1_OCTVU|nr:Hypothetical predicted protein [Octopus vulgaris]
MRNIVILATLLASVAAYDRTDASKCTKDKADIFFLLDSSDSTSQLFEKQKIFVNKMLDSLEIEYGKVHIGIATFSDSFYLNLDLTFDVSYLKKFLGRLNPMGGSTKIGSALKSLLADGFRSHRARRTATKIAIVLTDGQSSDNPIAAAKALMAKNIKVFAVGDTYMNNQVDLRMIASRPTGYYVFNLNSNGLIGSIKNAVQCISPKTDCSALHNINLQFLIDTPSYSQKTSLKLINFVAETSAMLKETNAEFALGVNFGVMGQQDIAPNYHTDMALKTMSVTDSVSEIPASSFTQIGTGTQKDDVLKKKEEGLRVEIILCCCKDCHDYSEYSGILNIYIYIHTYIHIHTYIYICILRLWWYQETRENKIAA